MKRCKALFDFSEENTEGYIDIWTHIFNFYYLLKIESQFQRFKDFLYIEISCVFPPLQHIHVWRCNRVSICLKINKLYWNASGIYAMAMEEYRFKSDQPGIRIGHNPDRPEVVYIDTTLSGPLIPKISTQHAHLFITPSKKRHSVRLEIDISSLPEDIRKRLHNK